MGEIIGIDIGSYSIKAVKFDSKVKGAVSTYNPVGSFLPADEAQFTKLVATLKQFASENQFAGKAIAAAMPEALAYTSIVSMPFLSDAELASSIHWEAEQHIPVPLEEVQLEYQVLSKPKKGAVGEKMQVLLVASKKSVVERVSDLFDAAGLELVNLETGLLAGYRSIAGIVPQTGGVAFLNMGALSTDILIVESGKMMLTYTIQTGGLVLTRAIQQGLGLTGQQAEEYKRAYGLDAAQLEGKVVQALTPVMNILIGEIRKAVQYYQSSQMGSGIATVLLTGGASYLRGLPAYLTQMLSAEVMVVNPFQTATLEKDVVLPKDVAAFGVAAGLVNSSAT